MASPPLPPGSGEAHPAGWPEALRPLAEHFLTCEFSSLTLHGEPITYPVTPYPGQEGRTIDVSTGLTYPAKAERARRNPGVGLLFSNPLGSGMMRPPIALVMGLATVRDRDLQANTDRYVNASLTRLAGMYRGVPSLLLQHQAWYFARIWIQVTPLRVLWWPEGNLDAPPHSWKAPAGLEVPPSDPPPAGKAPPSGAKAPADWHAGATAALRRYGPPVLTVVDEEGFPAPVRVRQASLAPEGFRLDVPVGIPFPLQGPACLTFHTHSQTFTTQENTVFAGTVTRTGAGVWFAVKRQLADWSVGRSRLTAAWSFVARGHQLRNRLAPEAVRRGQDIPQVHLPGKQMNHA
jgi:hypothetical protein